MYYYSDLLGRGIFGFLGACTVYQSREATGEDCTKLVRCPSPQGEAVAQNNSVQKTGAVTHVVVRVALGKVESVPARAHRQSVHTGRQAYIAILFESVTPSTDSSEKMNLRSFRIVGKVSELSALTTVSLTCWGSRECI